MRNLAVGLPLVLLVGAALGFGFTAMPSPGDAQDDQATLRLVRRAPLTVRGDHFRAGERVQLRASVRRAAKRTTADEQGAFVTSLGTPTTRCDLVRVVAIRSGGITVVLKLLPAPACNVVRRP